MPARPASQASVRLAGTARALSRGTVQGAAPPAATAGQRPPRNPAQDVPRPAVRAAAGVLRPTCWLDPGQAGEPFTATVRFSGRRTDVTGMLQPRDSFWQEETVNGIVPGSGPVAITAEVRGVNPGQWTVTGRPAGRAGGRPYRSYPPPGHDPAGRCRAPWPRRVGIPAESTAALHPTSLLRSKVPGVIRFAYATLAGLGVLAGLALQALLLSHGHYPLLRPMLFSVIAIVAGVIGGKSWYIAAHRGRKADGWCIQGFVAGAAVAVAAAALAGTGLPAGVYLAAAGPALLIGMAIGRPGCFWAGCCTGRPTAARWGIWSSDRRLGCRRAPAQLLEALAALISGGAVLAVAAAMGLARSGPAAIAGLAAYTLGRQFILGLRSEAPVWRYGRPVTAAIAALALIAGVILLRRG
jgi:phosphatidylglycerol:prolipoprotein diacylglycerol transferase